MELLEVDCEVLQLFSQVQLVSRDYQLQRVGVAGVFSLVEVGRGGGRVSWVAVEQLVEVSEVAERAAVQVFEEVSAVCELFGEVGDFEERFFDGVEFCPVERLASEV